MLNLLRSICFYCVICLFTISGVAECGEPPSTITPNISTTATLEDQYKSNCIYTDDEARESPWTAILRLEGENVTVDFYVSTILDEFTVVTYGRPFHFTTNKLAFLPWTNYTILIGAVKNGTEITHSQSLQVSYIQPHPKYARKINYQLWMFTDNDYVVIHLKTPIKLSSTVRAVCLPTIQNDTTNTLNELNYLYAENTTAIVGGWKRYLDFQKTAFTVKLSSEEFCLQQWGTNTRSKLQDLPFQNRVCGYVSQPSADAVCIVKDSGVLANHSGRYTFMGFVNTFYSDAGICTKAAFFYIFKLSPYTLNWLNATVACGSFQYTCHNGDCAPSSSVCNQKLDGCSDESDEDPVYCRALNPCSDDQFACGVYGQCIPKFQNGKEIKKCDNVAECPLGEDEDEDECDVPVVGIPAGKVFSGIGIGVSIFLVLTVPASILIYKRIQRNSRWRLAESYIEYFELGCEQENATEIEKVYNKPYDSTTYEISLDNIVKGEKIGTGNFGDVFKGVVNAKGNLKAKDCAIKIPKKNADPEQVKCFLKELKIMAHVGKHENITNIIGAHTTKLRDGILYIILEYCELGSLEDFLTKYKQCFNNQLKSIGNPISSLPRGYVSVDLQVFCTTDLVQWASQVASGMAHLDSKNVIHGDLASRNILLDDNKRAKICDFGLSHHLYTNATYVAAKESLLPWKWMAVEALLDRELSTKSDVWSFGITLWEMFSLGEEPYGDLEWNPGFPYSLSSKGCQLEQPEFANSEIFKTMKECWAITPSDRPTFDELVKVFTDSELIQAISPTEAVQA